MKRQATHKLPQVCLFIVQCATWKKIIHFQVESGTTVTRKTTRKAEQMPDFEAALAELENLVELMETGDITLEESLAHFERGVKLTRQCQQALKQAEQKVQILMQDNGEPLTFEPPNNGDDESDGNE